MDSNLPQEMPGRSKKVIRTAFVLLVAVILLVGLNTLFNKSSKTSKNIRQPDSIYKEYDVLGFSLTYPRSWKENHRSIAKGTTYQEKDREPIVALDGNVELITLSKGDYQLLIEAQKEFQKDACGGMATSAWRDGFPVGLQELKILGKDALRPAVEKGMPANIFGASETSTLTIEFKRLPGEAISPADVKKYPNAVKHCFEDTEKPLRLKIIYYSPTLTRDNISQGKIDKKIIEEIDQIISGLKYI